MLLERGKTFKVLLVLSSLACLVAATENEEKPQRGGKFMSMFQIVSFPNDVCASSSAGRNGTCYTSDECSDKGGSSSGSCADGFGVCCVFSISCGDTSSQNNTFLVQKAVTTLSTNPCTYTICRASDKICRIRFDFTIFDIAGPVVGTAGTNVATQGTAVGDCVTDTFSVTAPGQAGSPVICGYNTGQHMYVDASSECHHVKFDIASGDGTSRNWDIKVTQYECGMGLAGDDGCLQYHTGVSGTISSFNFPTASSTVGATATHLSSQEYSICIRRESGYCAICYTPAIQPDAYAVIDQVSFGVGNTGTMSLVSTDCDTDYLEIPLGQNVDGTPVPLVLGEFPATTSRFCGRVLHATTAQAYNFGNAVSVCSQHAPFTVDVHFNSNEDEATDMEVAATAASAGIVGFSLNYRQISC